MFIYLIIADLYIYRGYYLSKIELNTNSENVNEDFSSNLTLVKDEDSEFTFTFKNNSFNVKYFTGYPYNEKYVSQLNVFFLSAIGRNIKPNKTTNYSTSYNYPKGNRLVSINPYDEIVLTKSYTEIVNDFSNLENIIQIVPDSLVLGGTENSRSTNTYIKKLSKEYSLSDSIYVEYFLHTYTFLNKDQKFVRSNQVKICIKDIVKQYENKKPDCFRTR